MAGYFEIRRGAGGAFRFNLKAGNHETILTSETYTTKDAALNGIESVRKNAAEDGNFDRRTAKDGSPYFVLIAGNQQVIGKSEMYSGESAMENGISSVQNNAIDAKVVDKSDEA